jgi:hypothetical protein
MVKRLIANNPVQQTVSQLRCLPAADLHRWAYETMLRTFAIVALALLLASGTSFAAKAHKDPLVTISPGFSFGVVTPDGWTRTKADFAPAVFHPSKYPYDRSPVILYVRSASKAELGVKTIAELNAFDLKEMRSQWPRISSKPQAIWPLPDGTSAPTYSFQGGQFQELVAYIEHPKSITVFVLSADTNPILKSSLPAFRALVESYRWLPELSSQ